MIFILLILFSGCQYRETIEAPTSNLETTSNATTQVVQDAPNDEGFDANPLMLFSEMPLPTNQNMPPLMLKTYYNSKNESLLTDLHIINTATKQSVGDFSFANYADSWPDTQGVSHTVYQINFIDVNFDSYTDIQIFAGPDGTWNQHYLYFIWDSATGRFIDDPYGLSALGLPHFDTVREVVMSMQRASAGDHWAYTHRYSNNQLVMVQEEARNLVWGLENDDATKQQLAALEPLYDGHRTAFILYTKKQPNTTTGELITTERKYILIDKATGDEYAEYTPDSAVGLLLEPYETSSYLS